MSQPEHTRQSRPGRKPRSKVYHPVFGVTAYRGRRSVLRTKTVVSTEGQVTRTQERVMEDGWYPCSADHYRMLRALQAHFWASYRYLVAANRELELDEITGDNKPKNRRVEPLVRPLSSDLFLLFDTRSKRWTLTPEARDVLWDYRQARRPLAGADLVTPLRRSHVWAADIVRQLGVVVPEPHVREKAPASGT